MRRTAGISVLCVLICICSLLAITLLTVRNATSEEHLQTSLEAMLTEADLTQMPAADLVSDAYEDESMAEYIAREIKKNYVVEVDVEAEDVQKFLENSTIIPFLAEKLSGLADDVRNDSRGAGITKKDISDLMWDNQKQIEKLVGVQMSQKDVDSVINSLNKEGLLEDLSAKAMKSEDPAVYAGAQVLLSDWTIIGLFVLIFGMAVLIAMGYRWNICRTCGSLGVTLMVSGGIFLLLCGASYILAMAWNSMISYLIRMVVSGSLLSSVLFFVLGAILVAVDRITRKQE